SRVFAALSLVEERALEDENAAVQDGRLGCENTRQRIGRIRDLALLEPVEDVGPALAKPPNLVPAERAKVGSQLPDAPKELVAERRHAVKRAKRPYPELVRELDHVTRLHGHRVDGEVVALKARERVERL